MNVLKQLAIASLWLLLPALAIFYYLMHYGLYTVVEFFCHLDDGSGNLINVAIVVALMAGMWLAGLISGVLTYFTFRRN